MFIKPLRLIHGWRVFFGEVAIIVLGVLIALAAQQAVEAWNWRASVADAERQLVAETQDNFYYAAERVIVAPCIDAQLDRMIALAMVSGARLRPLPAIKSVTGDKAFRQPTRPYRIDGWNGIVTDGIAAHFAEDRRNLFSAAYTQLEDMRDLTKQGDFQSAGLSIFIMPIELDPAIRAHLVGLAVSQKANNDLLALESIQVMGNLWALGAAPPAADIDDSLSQQKSGTIEYCRDHGLPLDNWRSALTAERASTVASDDQVGRYLARHER